MNLRLHPCSIGPLRKVLAGAVLLISFPPTASSQSVQPEEFVLENGLKVVMVEDHTVPSVCFAVAFRVGSRNERPGITGISHLFEHMMFNGSKNYRPTEFDRILENGGGYSNAYTWNDITFYFEEFNPDMLETVLHMEADRMQWLKIDSANLEQERGIVKEERRVSTDNSVEGKIYEELYAAAYVAHPYQFPVVGWMGDLDNITLEDAREYFRIYYAPNNATVFVVGDFNPSQVRTAMERHFAGIPPQPPPRTVNNSEPVQQGEKRIDLHKEAELPAVAICYKSAPGSSADLPAIGLLSRILADGQSSRLHKRLVYNLQMATGVSATADEFIDPGLFSFYVQMQPGYFTTQAEEEIYATISDIAQNGVTERELQKAKNGAETSYIAGFKTNVGIANRLGYYEVVFGDYRKSFDSLESYRSVTGEDIRRVASGYLNERGRTVVTLIPE